MVNYKDYPIESCLVTRQLQYYEDLVGVLYLGPVSTQLSYCQYASSDGHLHLYGINYEVQTENLMCGGWNESWRNITASLVQVDKGVSKDLLSI